MDKQYNYIQHLEKLYRPHLEKSYRDEFICFDKNEAPFSAFEVIDGLINNNDIKNLRQYPDPYLLYKRLASFLKVEIENLLLTHGSEQGINYIFQVILEKGDEVVYLNPSFAMYDVFTYIQQAKKKYIYFQDFKLDLELVLSSISKKTKLFVLANPNNPTGTAFQLNELIKIAQKLADVNGYFLIDEAYFYYFNIDTISMLKDFSNIFLTRSFSKAFGLAGLRVGFVISNKKNIELLRKVKLINEINRLSIIVAYKALEKANQIIKKNIHQVKKWKEIFKKTKLKNMEYIPTEGNFILLKSLSYDFHKKLFIDNKILPKMDFSHNFLKNCFRFSILDDNTMKKLLEIINKC
jgi:histidinol-phosphate aminotransferase